MGGTGSRFHIASRSLTSRTGSSVTGGTQTTMMHARQVTEILNRDFLETRCRILEVAAALDRLDRAPSHPGAVPDRRLAQLRRAIEVLLEPGPDRAETVQRLFSLDYDSDWQTTLG